MDEKMKEVLKGIYENLTDEQKEKAKACKTMDEVMALADKWGIELPDEVVDAVAGGITCESFCPWQTCESFCPWLEYDSTAYGQT